MGDGNESTRAAAEVPARLPAAGRCAVAGFVFLFAIASVACAASSEGFLTADALTHYLYAQYAFQRPTYLVDVWGRPFVTAMYAVPASLGGRLAVRMTSLGLALSCAAVAYRIARAQGVRRPSLAVVFTLAQPLVFLHSFAEMTELPFAVLAGLAFWAYQTRHWLAAAVLVSLTPLARPEGFGLVLMAAVGLLWGRRVWPLLVLPLPLLLWNYAGWELYGRPGPWWRWLVDNWPYAGRSAYPAGSLLQFVFFLPVVVSPLLLPATLLGIWLSADRVQEVTPLGAGAGAGRPAVGESHARQCAAMTAVIPLFIVIVHSVLYGTGRLASYGEPRYLLVAAPFWAVLSARGWDWAYEAMEWRRPLAGAMVAALLPAAALLVHPVLPLRAPGHWAMAKTFAGEYRRQFAADYPRVLASHPAVFYYLGVDPQDPSSSREWSRSTVAEAPPGTLLVWDPIYSARNADGRRLVTLEEVRQAGWVPVPAVDEVLNRPVARPDRRPTPDPAEALSGGEGWHVFHSPAPGNADAAPRR